MSPPENVFCMWKDRLWPAEDRCEFDWYKTLPVGRTTEDWSSSKTKESELNYGKALKLAGDILKPLSLSASHTPHPANTRETMGDKKESSRATTRQKKTKIKEKGQCEQSYKKQQKKSETAVSEDPQKIPTTEYTVISPTKRSIPQSIQRSRTRPLDKDEPECKEETACAVSFAGAPKSKNNVSSKGKSKGCINTPISEKKKLQKASKPHSVQRRLHVPSKRVSKTSTDLQTESSETDTEKGNGQKAHKNSKHHMPDFEEEQGLSSSELSMEISSPECTTVHALFPSHDDTEEDIQLPVVVLQKEPEAIIPGSFVWCKFQHYPFWPSLVKLVDSKNKRASIIFLEESISDPTEKKKSFKVALRSLKPYDCPEKQQLLADARKEYGKSIDWCDSLITDYRIRLGCGSFTGSFLEYCTAAISLPVRRELQIGKREVVFPVLGSEVAKAQEEGIKSQTNRRILPDRARAARDRANEKLVEFIVNAKETEHHLLDILSGKKKSQFLQKFQLSNHRINCLETYIEDEEQIEVVVDYLQTICKKTSSAAKQFMLGDQTQFIFEVLIPEAVIFAIAATEQISYEEAEVKYRKGPSVTKRERRMFEEQILEKKRSKLSQDAKIKKDSRKPL